MTARAFTSYRAFTRNRTHRRPHSTLADAPWRQMPFKRVVLSPTRDALLRRMARQRKRTGRSDGDFKMSPREMADFRARAGVSHS